MTDPYCNRCGTPHHAGHCGRDNAIRTPTDHDPRTGRATSPEGQATLRDRIAYAIAQADGGDLPGPDSWDYKLADAVISELGMEKDFGCRTAAHHGCRCSYRYVTEWTTNE